MQLDLMDYIARPYPFTTGAKTGTTSREAGDVIEQSGKAGRLRDAVFEALKGGSSTGTELAADLNESILSVRPRLSELKARGLIEESGLRRERQHVWRIRY